VIRSWKTLSTGLFAASLTVIAAACGSGSTDARLLNAMDNEGSLNMLIANKTIASGVTFGAASAYSSSASGSQSLQIQGAGQTLINQTVSINGGKHNTVLATDSGPTIFEDNSSAPSSGNIQLRVINAAFNLGTADVYIVTPGTDISTLNPNFTLSFQSASAYVNEPAGSYEIEITSTGSKIVLINSNSLSFSSGQIRTIVALDNTTVGGFTLSVLSDLN
jgi:hypothetical protein